MVHYHKLKLSETPSKRGSFPARSLESLQEDHARFLSEGRGNLKVAKNYNNVIGVALFQIPLSNVSHILVDYNILCPTIYISGLHTWIASLTWHFQ